MLVGEVTGAEGTQGTLGTPVSLPGEIRAAPPGSLTSCPYPDESAVASWMLWVSGFSQ